MRTGKRGIGDNDRFDTRFFERFDGQPLLYRTINWVSPDFEKRFRAHRSRSPTTFQISTRYSHERLPAACIDGSQTEKLDTWFLVISVGAISSQFSIVIGAEINMQTLQTNKKGVLYTLESQYVLGEWQQLQNFLYYCDELLVYDYY